MNNTIQSTLDFDKFKILNGNRKTSTAHINKLKSAFKGNTQATKFSPILVNEHMEVIDGQHRLEAIKQLDGVPIYYIVHAGLTLEDAQNMNSMMRNWAPRDYAKSYAELGNKHYQGFIDLMNEYESLSFTVLLKYASPLDNYPTTEMFRNGLFKMDKASVVHDRLNYLCKVGDYTVNFKRKKFGEALLKVMYLPNFDRDRFVRALAGSRAQERLKKTYDNWQDYVRVIEKIYNAGLSEDKKQMFAAAGL